MKKDNIKNRIKSLNEYMLSDSDLKLLLLKISNDYTYNKGIALVDKNYNGNNWYEIDDKNCFKTWDEIDAFIDGLCRGKNTNFDMHEKERER